MTPPNKKLKTQLRELSRDTASLMEHDDTIVRSAHLIMNSLERKTPVGDAAGEDLRLRRAVRWMCRSFEALIAEVSDFEFRWAKTIWVLDGINANVPLNPRNYFRYNAASFALNLSRQILDAIRLLPGRQQTIFYDIAQQPISSVVIAETAPRLTPMLHFIVKTFPTTRSRLESWKSSLKAQVAAALARARLPKNEISGPINYDNPPPGADVKPLKVLRIVDAKSGTFINRKTREDFISPSDVWTEILLELCNSDNRKQAKEFDCRSDIIKPITIQRALRLMHKDSFLEAVIGLSGQRRGGYFMKTV